MAQVIKKMALLAKIAREVGFTLGSFWYDSIVFILNSEQL
tara:strand:- start:97 stop:216 length:120 start_codon:yes stop_codon:yes gene_type:complete